jgi:DNA (cytosine-5)-methyltransferase 1
MVEMVKRTMPRIFIAENVKGLLMKTHAHDLASVVKDFSDLGYHLSINLYNSADYGVPQTRERVFIVGVVDSTCRFDPPLPTHSKSAHITALEAIHDLESVPEEHAINHIWSRANKSPDQGNRKLVANRPGYTIRAECHGNIQWHYALQRRISMREAARIQSFPDSFIFESKLRETERQIGNAVPPVLAWHVGKSIAKTLIKSDYQQLQAAA